MIKTSLSTNKTLLIFCFLRLSISYAQIDTTIHNPIQDYAVSMLSFSTLKHAPFSFYVKDLSSKKVIADVNSQMSIPAASTMKLVTTSTAIKILGTKYRFTTKLAYSGAIDTATQTLNGDLYIIGGGDPTLGSKYYNKSGHERDFLKKWADTLCAMGIQEINGRVIGDASIYAYQGVPGGWVWSDLGNYYGAGPSGLTIFDNMIKLHFNTGDSIGGQTSLTCIKPFIPNFQLRNTVKSTKSKKDNAYVYGAPFSNFWTVRGSIPFNNDDFVVKASMPDPEYICAIELDYELNQAGIKTKYQPKGYQQLLFDSTFVKPQLNVIYKHYSPSLTSIINLTNQRSVNLFAEHLLCQLAVKRNGYGSTYGGTLIVQAYWKAKLGVNNGLFMTDGSGLSRSNAVSADFLVSLLDYMKNSKTLKNSLAIAGKKGTMASIGRGTSAQGRVIGKSGTMTRMKAYTGYVNTKTGKKLGYAMIINNYSCYTSKVKKYFEKLMIKMADY
jgi:D-alanyl-D-alanine carboxypeptidase/D-alanyl-D-alanine-endopeptidase (penicillin-binding protein 4)